MTRLLFLMLAFSISIMTSLSASELSWEEKVGQLLMVHFSGEELNAEAKSLIQESHVGGFIYYNWANQLKNPQQVRNLSQQLQEEAALKQVHKIPLLIAVDQEGGPVSRLKTGFTPFPSNRAIAKAGNPEWMEEAAYATGRQLRAVGINMNLAPVVDVDANPLNPVIHVRSFGSDPAQVTLFGKAALQGYQRAEVLACLKHFPGHGDVTCDSHNELPVVQKSAKDFWAVDLAPFKALSAAAPAIMTAHISVPSLDADHVATFSPKLLNDLLRKKLGFSGVVISDSLVMSAAVDSFSSIEETALRALESGCDLLLLGGKSLNDQGIEELTAKDVKRIHHFLVHKVHSDPLLQEKVNLSVERILKLKSQIAPPLLEENYLEACDHPSLREISLGIAKRALTYVIEKPPYPIHGKIAILSPDVFKEHIVDAAWRAFGTYPVKVVTWEGISPNKQELQSMQQRIGNAEIVIMVSYNGFRHSGQQQLVHCLQSRPLFLVAAGLSHDLVRLGEKAKIAVGTHSPDAISLETAFRALFKLK